MNIKRFKYPCIISVGFLVWIVLISIQWRLQTTYVERTFSNSQLTGYVQTPIGGRLGTSDLLRPDLAELGIKTAPIFAQTTTQSIGRWDFYTGYEQIRAEGNARLKKALTTYGQKIPVDIPLKTGIKFDVYRFGWAYPIPVGDSEGSRGELALAIEGVLLDFGYRFKTSQLNSGRTYRNIGMRVGFIFRDRSHIPSSKFSDHDQLVSVSFFRTIPLSQRLSIASTSNQIAGDYFSFTTIKFKDNQPLPNHLSLIAGTEEGRVLQPDDKLLARFPSPVFSKTKSLDWK